MAYTLAGTTLPNVQVENWRKLSTIIVIPNAGQDDTSTDVIDFGGATTEITIEGKCADTVSNVRTFISFLMGLIDGKQSSTGNKTYHSDLRNANYSLKIDSADFSLDYPADFSSGTIVINYSIKMIIGRSTS